LAIGTRLLSLLFSGILTVNAQGQGDPRLLARDHPADWQRAIVKLRIPVGRTVEGQRRTFIEDCTGTIVSITPPQVLSAWHCFDGYDDLSRPPQMLLAGNWEDTRLIASGGSMAADWALLSFRPGLLDSHKLSALPVTAAPLFPGVPLILAGFSSDPGLGEGGEVLTYHAGCTVDRVEHHRVASSCVAYRGASGGPALQSIDGEMTVTGVLSGKGGNGTRFLVPARLFVRAVR